MTLDGYIIGIGGALIALLLAGNAYFIKRLIDKIETTHVSATQANASAEKATAGVNGLGGLMREIKQEIKDLRRIEIEVAVLRDRMGLKRRKAPTSDEIGDEGPSS